MMLFGEASLEEIYGSIWNACNVVITFPLLQRTSLLLICGIAVAIVIIIAKAL